MGRRAAGCESPAHDRYPLPHAAARGALESGLAAERLSGRGRRQHRPAEARQRPGGCGGQSPASGFQRARRQERAACRCAGRTSARRGRARHCRVETLRGDPDLDVRSARCPPIDAVLASMAQTYKQLQAMGGGLGASNALDSLSKSGQADALQSLQQQAKLLPAPLGALVAQIGTRSQATAVGQARDELSRRYDEQVARECRELVDGRYPFSRSSANDLPLADFGHVFGYGGVFDKFFQDNLVALVDVSRTPWRWREGAAGIGGSAALLKQFQQAQRIREVYFKPGTQMPEARFNLTPDTLDAAATRFTLDLDGQRLESRHGPLESKAMVWP